MTTSLLAILTGLLFVNLMTPGIINGEPAREILGFSQESAAQVAEKVEGRSASDLTGVFLSMVPPNIVAAAADGQMLGLIFFSRSIVIVSWSAILFGRLRLVGLG